MRFLAVILVSALTAVSVAGIYEWWITTDLLSVSPLGADITTINASDLISNSRAVINTNFSNLNTQLTAIASSYFPFTPTSYGNATSSILGLTGGAIIVGSTTLPSLTSGLVSVTNGKLGTDTATYLTSPVLIASGGTNNTGSFADTGIVRYQSSSQQLNTVAGYTLSSSLLTATNIAATTLGVGSTTPWGALSINPNGITGPAFAIGSSTATNLIVTNGGYVGLGTTSPWGLLSVNPNGIAGPSFAIGSSTQTLFAISQTGQIRLVATQPATSTAMTLDWAAAPQQVEYQIGSAAVSITIINATTSDMWSSTKRVWVCNPGGTAGALTWAGVEWIGTAPTQTTTANQCDIYSFNVTRATSTTAYKVAGTAGAGFK